MFGTWGWHWSTCRQGGRGEDRLSGWLENCFEGPAQRTELSNVRETGWKIEGKTGQRAELSNVRETGWKIEGKTGPENRLEQRVGNRVKD